MLEFFVLGVLIPKMFILEVLISKMLIQELVPVPIILTQGLLLILMVVA